MISFEKGFLVLVQTICVGGLCVGIVASNAEQLNKYDNMIPAVLGVLAVTALSGIASLGLAEQPKNEVRKPY